MKLWRWSTQVVAAILAAATMAPAHASTEQPGIAVRAELLEQAACLVGSDGYRASFELRAVYTNTGRVPVRADIAGAIVAGVSFVPAGAGGATEKSSLAFGMPAGSDGAVALPADVVVLEPGRAVSGRRTMVWVPLATWLETPGDALVPGTYQVRFDVRLAVEGRAAGTEGPDVFVHLSTEPMTIRVPEPTQVQECGSFSLPLLPSP